MVQRKVGFAASFLRKRFNRVAVIARLAPVRSIFYEKLLINVKFSFPIGVSAAKMSKQTRGPLRPALDEIFLISIPRSAPD
jgi:hypothetical protein